MRRRCAVYTRKSSEEGLEQAFNSLHAQREACEAYVASQAGEGWHLMKARYDDGGVSGGTLERPALQRLLADIEARKVDTVVVYKVDRLTRSLADFAKMVDVFDRAGASFVSVTQQFNTTTSMGRLTLNMLLSFAQFEREVTGERIRDKIAASKKKGMWMGGNPPLGYDVKDRKLVVNKEEAELVRAIFRRYAELQCVARLKQELDAQGARSKFRVSETGRRIGGKSFSRGALYRLLQNRTYLGLAVHKENAYSGEHKAIIDQELWDRVQQTIAGNRQDRTNGTRANEPSLLAGLLFDDRGNRLSPSHAVKNDKRYRYYVSQALLQNRKNEAGPVTRIAAQEIEDLAGARIRAFLRDPATVMDELAESDADLQTQHRLLAAAEKQAKAWPRLAPSDRRALVRAAVERVMVGENEVEIVLSRRRLRRALLGKESPAEAVEIDADETSRDCEADRVTIRIEARLKRCSGEMRLVIPAGATTDLAPRPDAALIKALTRAYAWKERLISGEAKSIRALARELGVTNRYIRKLLPLAFLAPDIVEAILEGRQPRDLFLETLVYTSIPMAWDEQRTALGF